jgi:hypothetical protein
VKIFLLLHFGDGVGRIGCRPRDLQLGRMNLLIPERTRMPGPVGERPIVLMTVPGGMSLSGKTLPGLRVRERRRPTARDWAEDSVDWDFSLLGWLSLVSSDSFVDFSAREELNPGIKASGIPCLKL